MLSLLIYNLFLFNEIIRILFSKQYVKFRQAKLNIFCLTSGIYFCEILNHDFGLLLFVHGAYDQCKILEKGFLL